MILQQRAQNSELYFKITPAETQEIGEEPSGRPARRQCADESKPRRASQKERAREETNGREPERSRD